MILFLVTGLLPQDSHRLDSLWYSMAAMPHLFTHLKNAVMISEGATNDEAVLRN
jgi:hypothetical protein